METPALATHHLDDIPTLSYFLPESTSASRFQDPSCWWGQGAALGVLLDQSRL